MILAYTIVNNTQQAGIAADMRKVDVERQESQQQEAVLSTYIHDINDLIFSHGLYTSKSGEQVRVVARAQTLAALRQLNGKRKGVVLQFLSESGLITGRGKQPQTIISLDGADCFWHWNPGSSSEKVRLLAVNRRHAGGRKEENSAGRSPPTTWM